MDAGVHALPDAAEGVEGCTEGTRVDASARRELAAPDRLRNEVEMVRTGAVAKRRGSSALPA